MKQVKMSEIRIDGGTQSRVVIDQTTVYDYRDAIKEGNKFPPLETRFDGVMYWLVDGFHRHQAYKLLNFKTVDVDPIPGSQTDAQIASFGSNGLHGKQRTNDDKRKAVAAALVHPQTKDLTSYELAKICCVSQPFIAAQRSPEKKASQDNAKIKSKAEKKNIENDVQTTNRLVSDDGSVPDAAELEANDLALQYDVDALHKLLEADDALKVAYEEIEKLHSRVAQLEIRQKGLMNEKNAAIDLVKKLQKQLDQRKPKK